MNRLLPRAMAAALVAAIALCQLALAETKTSTETDENGNTTTTTTSTSTQTTKDGGYYKEKDVKVRVEDKNGKVVKKTRTRTRSYYDARDEAGDYSQENWDSVPDGSGGSTESSSSVTEHSDGTVTGDTETYHMDAGGKITSGERTHTGADSWLGPPAYEWHERWDPADNKWVHVSYLFVPLNNGFFVIPFKAASLKQVGGTNQGGAALPPFAGPSSQIVLTIEPNPAGGGAQGTLLLAEDQMGRMRYFRPKSKNAVNIAMGGPANAVLRSISLVSGFDEQGKPVIASRCEIGNPTRVPGTDIVARPPARGPAITETNSAAQPGELVQAHIRGDDPLTTRFLLDGRPVSVFGVSDNSATFRIPANTTLANHQLVMESGGERSNAVSIAIVQLVPEPVAPSQAGLVQTITIHVNGLTPGEQADMYFEVGGAAQMLDGGATTAAPVINGLTHVQVRGTRAGQALLRFRLHVRNAQFVSSERPRLADE